MWWEMHNPFLSLPEILGSVRQSQPDTKTAQVLLYAMVRTTPSLHNKRDFWSRMDGCEEVKSPSSSLHLWEWWDWDRIIRHIKSLLLLLLVRIYQFSLGQSVMAFPLFSTTTSIIFTQWTLGRTRKKGVVIWL